MTRFCLFFLCLFAPLAIAQDHIPRSRVELLEHLQNDLSSALAHGNLTYDDRVNLNEINGILGRNIGAERGSQHADERELKNMLKETEKLARRSGIAPPDRVMVERDCEELKYNLEHGPPVYRGYHQPLKY